VHSTGEHGPERPTRRASRSEYLHMRDVASIGLTASEEITLDMETPYSTKLTALPVDAVRENSQLLMLPTAKVKMLPRATYQVNGTFVNCHR